MPKEKHGHESERSHHHKKGKHRSRSRNRDQERESDSDRHRHKKHVKHRSISISTSSASPPTPSSHKLIKVLEQRRIQEHLERKRQKEQLKAEETSEQKRARRLREKQEKELRRRQRMGWDTEYQHYTNQDNPFGDSNLMCSFVWNKKLEKEGFKDVSAETVEVLSRQKQLENKLELEKVKKRRMERELERQAREDEATLQQRMKEAAQFQEWERQEDQFHLEQARLRSVIRIQDGRAKPIDLLAQYVSETKLEDAIQMHEPYHLLDGLCAIDLEDLLVDIKVYVALEKGNNSDFWDDMTVIVEDELHKLRKIAADEESVATVSGRREGIHQSVVKDVSDIFRGKSTAQLNVMRSRIEEKINARADGVDVSYWESLLSQLRAHMARSRLRDRHQERLREKLKMLKTAPDEDSATELPTTSANALHRQVKNEENSADENSEGEDSQNADKLLEACFHLYDLGNYSPIYISPNELDSTMPVLTEERDQQNIDNLRQKLNDRHNEEEAFSQQELQMRSEARKGMMDDEVEFSVETVVEAPMLPPSDKYRPRKPRYFNRVHTGFEWNKYNQTHYDMDNPPPKIVQGYKFNIFYPDLIDKNATPQYFLTPCKDNGDFAVLRFHAGPPYEDIAFKIVNREWEFSYKRGFRCQFHNNIFQLWFHFKRYRYRR